MADLPTRSQSGGDTILDVRQHLSTVAEAQAEPTSGAEEMAETASPSPRYSEVADVSTAKMSTSDSIYPSPPQLSPILAWPINTSIHTSNIATTAITATTAAMTTPLDTASSSSPATASYPSQQPAMAGEHASPTPSHMIALSTNHEPSYLTLVEHISHLSCFIICFIK